jgi:hypothetical protein
VPPSAEAVAEIQRYGDMAIPALEEHVFAPSAREAQLALRFLGLLGGSRIVAPLKQVVEKSADPDRRIDALTWLTQAPWNLALPIIRTASESDPDPKVREVARDLMVNRAP